MRRPIVSTVDYWSTGWDGGGVRGLIVMIHAFSPSSSLPLSLISIYSFLSQLISCLYITASLLHFLCAIADYVSVASETQECVIFGNGISAVQTASQNSMKSPFKPC